ncbi:hypothetical protein BTJ68_14755 [Hortaea werneckii EXF-2000]|uniref:feruloyl esterase n=1 Tax=Hortaea werneckii EXF-2000 TaxID=1157616 RepID=A0A1Z5SMQ2_HORWE|nr:hypothetical protein BTJ68_14755 [Hortaea werneckii EXF-2000]
MELAAILHNNGTISQYYTYQRSEDYVVVYPQGYDKHWQGPSYATEGVDDLRFTSDLLAHMESEYCIDSSRVYASGKSNGGGFVDLLACSDAGDAFAAFAMASAALYTDTSLDSCTKRRAILESHGDQDTTIPYHPQRAWSPNRITYYGDRSKLDDWLNQMALYFRFENITQDPKKTLLASSYLRGQVQQWIRPRLHEVLHQNIDTEGIFNSWDNYVKAIRNIYGLSNEKQVAIRVIQHLKQKTSTSQYTAKFREYSGKTGWDDQALLTMYYTGLKDDVKDELMRSGGSHDTLELMIQDAIEIDDKLYERKMEKRHNGQYRGRSGYNSTSWTGGSRRDPDAMELDIIQRKPKGKGMRGAKGHYARDCRGRKVRPQEQLNMMLVKEPIDEANDGRGAYDVSKLVEETEDGTRP